MPNMKRCVEDILNILRKYEVSVNNMKVILKAVKKEVYTKTLVLSTYDSSSRTEE